MQVSKQSLPKNVVELTIELSAEELIPYMEEAANEMTAAKPLEGFRPGKAPYAIVKQRLGEMPILQHAVNTILGKTYYDVIEQEKLETVEQPNIEIVKVAPGNSFIYKATVALLPSTELPEYKELKTKAVAEVKVTDDEVEKVLNDLKEMRAKEINVVRPAKIGDKVEVAFETFVDSIAIPNGKAEKYPLVLGRNQMIPGFEDALVGLNPNDDKEFELHFPKDYKEEKIAGKKANFKVKMLQVFERQMPEVDDEFAKSLGLKSKEELIDNLKHNIEHEKQHREQEAKDLEMMNLLIDKSKFGEIPDVLVTTESRKMIDELKENVARQGMVYEDYLEHLKKKESDLLLDFAADAIKRVKTTLIIRAVAQKENMLATDAEIEFERQQALQQYQMNPQFAAQLSQIEENIKSEGAKNHFANIITTRKVVNLLRKAMIPGYTEHHC